MRTTPDADELDLPPLDGVIGGPDEHDHEVAAADDLDDLRELGDAFDDAPLGEDPVHEIAVDGAEAGWLVDTEAAGTLDVGPLDVVLSPEGQLLDDEEPEAIGADDDLAASDEGLHMDAGEEGPLADDEELREEDLPALDADDEGEVSDESLYDRAAIDTGEELRWDDRAWARVPELADAADADADESGIVPLPGEDARYAARDATWKRLEEMGGVTAAAVVPGDGVVVALDGAGRPVLVRVTVEGVARIIAEIEALAADDELDSCRVTGLRWDEVRGCVVATGGFGAQAFRPA